MTTKHIFKVIFVQNDTVYEIYAKQVAESDMFGFIVLEDMLFGEKTSVVVDPTEEKLKAMFTDVTRTYVPMSSVIRIDEVSQQGQAKISPLPKAGNNISPFPPGFARPETEETTK